MVPPQSGENYDQHIENHNHTQENGDFAFALSEVDDFKARRVERIRASQEKAARMKAEEEAKLLEQQEADRQKKLEYAASHTSTHSHSSITDASSEGNASFNGKHHGGFNHRKPIHASNGEDVVAKLKRGREIKKAQAVNSKGQNEVEATASEAKEETRSISTQGSGRQRIPLESTSREDVLAKLRKNREKKKSEAAKLKGKETKATAIEDNETPTKSNKTRPIPEERYTRSAKKENITPTTREGKYPKGQKEAANGQVGDDDGDDDDHSACKSVSSATKSVSSEKLRKYRRKQELKELNLRSKLKRMTSGQSSWDNGSISSSASHTMDSSVRSVLSSITGSTSVKALVWTTQLVHFSFGLLTSLNEAPLTGRYNSPQSPRNSSPSSSSGYSVHLSSSTILNDIMEKVLALSKVVVERRTGNVMMMCQFPIVLSVDRDEAWSYPQRPGVVRSFVKAALPIRLADIQQERVSSSSGVVARVLVRKTLQDAVENGIFDKFSSHRNMPTYA